MNSEMFLLPFFIQATLSRTLVTETPSGESIIRPNIDPSSSSAAESKPTPKLNLPPRWLRQRSSRWFMLWTCSFSIFTDVFLFGLLVPVIPFALSDRVGVEEANVQRWTSTLLAVYGAALLIGSPLSGWWVDKAERRRVPFLIGLVLLAGATVMLCVARSLPVLLIARILQGLSGSIVWTVAIIIMTDRVGARNFGANMGLLAITRSAGVVVGPLLGGALYAKAGYYAVFGISFGFLAADIICRCLLIETREAQKWGSSIAPEPDSIEDASDKQGKQGNLKFEEPLEQSARKRGSLYCLAHRLPPFITLLGSVRLLVAMWGCLVHAIVFGCMNAVLPLFVKGIFHWNSSGAGLVLLALMAPRFLSPVFGWLADKHGPRWYVAGGLLIAFIPLILLRLIANNSVDHRILLCALLCLVGMFSTCFEMPLFVEVISIVRQKAKEDPKHYGGQGAYAQAFGLSNMVWAAGTAAGPIWGGVVFENAGWATLTWTLAFLVAVSVVPSIIWVGGNICKKSLKGGIESSSYDNAG